MLNPTVKLQSYLKPSLTLQKQIIHFLEIIFQKWVMKRHPSILLLLWLHLEIIIRNITVVLNIILRVAFMGTKNFKKLRLLTFAVD